MARFRYAGLDKQNQPIKGIIYSSSEKEALQVLTRQYNVQKISIEERRTVFLTLLNRLREKLLVRVSDQSILLFTKELGLMLKSGVPFDKALGTIAKYQEDENLRKIIFAVKADIEGGFLLSRSLMKYRHIFPPIFIAMVQVGEETGRLAEVLGELSLYLEKELNTKKRIISALYYPAFVMGCTAVIITTLMIYYLPQFTTFLDGLSVKLPLATTILLNIIDTIKNPIAIVVILVVLVVAFYLYHSYTLTIVGRYTIDSIILKIPALGNLLFLIMLTRFARTFALMYKSGVQIDRVLEISKEIVQNEVLKDAFNQCIIEIRRGLSIGGAFSLMKFMPSMMKSFLTLGEETGDVVYPMEKISELYDEQVSQKIESLISILEPLFMALVASVVGFVVIALFLPIYSLISNIGM